MLIVQDDFNDGIINSSWGQSLTIATLEEVDGVLRFSVPDGEGATSYRDNYVTWAESFNGNFDITVDWAMPLPPPGYWITSNAALAVLSDWDSKDFYIQKRHHFQQPSQHNSYIAGLNGAGSGDVESYDESGKFRLIYTDSTKRFQAFYWDGIDWVTLLDKTYTYYGSNFWVRLHYGISGYGYAGGYVANNVDFDNFSLNYSEVKGLQLKGVFETIANKSKGIQLKGIFETQASKTKGLQLKGIYEIQAAQTKGLQLKGVFETKFIKNLGLQLKGIYEVQAGSSKGLQLKVIFNVEPPIAGSSKGLQLKGIFGIGPGTQAKGIQLKSIFEVKSTNVKGLQLKGIFEVEATKIKGLQLRGVFEIVSQQIQDIVGPFDVLNSQVEMPPISDIVGPLDVLNSNFVVGILGPFNLTDAGAEYNIGQWEIIGSKKSLKPPYKIIIDVIDAAYIQGGEDWQWCFLGSSAYERDGISPQANDFDVATQTDKKFVYLSTDGSVAPPQYKLF